MERVIERERFLREGSGAWVRQPWNTLVGIARLFNWNITCFHTISLLEASHWLGFSCPATVGEPMGRSPDVLPHVFLLSWCIYMYRQYKTHKGVSKNWVWPKTHSFNHTWQVSDNSLDSFETKSTGQNHHQFLMIWCGLRAVQIIETSMARWSTKHHPQRPGPRYPGRTAWDFGLTV